MLVKLSAALYNEKDLRFASFTTAQIKAAMTIVGATMYKYTLERCFENVTSSQLSLKSASLSFANRNQTKQRQSIKL